MSGKDTPGVVAPPPVLLLAAILGGVGLQRLVPIPLVPGGVPAAAGIVVIAAALSLAAASIREFRRAGTEYETRKPATALVVRGPYRWTRNPIYLVFLALQLGIALLANDASIAAMIAPLAAALHFGVILREERYLSRRLGPAYDAYRASVRRWL
jgi:protein-S-isoprenylcysteine O-methyltransferase Ste14